MKKDKMDNYEQKKLQNEIDLLQSIKHESCIKLLETFALNAGNQNNNLNNSSNSKNNSHDCIVMELCPAGDLLQYVRKRRKLPEP